MWCRALCTCSFFFNRRMTPSSFLRLGQILKPEQWQRLIQRLGQIQNPKVPAKPSAAALPAKGGDAAGD